jgi:hypothetical protein
LIRSCHWSRKARAETNLQLRVLFQWFAMEAILMVNKDHDIVPQVMWALGFLQGHAQLLIAPSMLAALLAHPRYETWRKRVRTALIALKTFRNDSVHSGFRPQDVPEDQLKGFDFLTHIGCPRVQALTKRAMCSGLTTVEELFEYIPLLFEASPNSVADAHGTVIFLFENPAAPGGRPGMRI